MRVPLVVGVILVAACADSSPDPPAETETVAATSPASGTVAAGSVQLPYVTEGSGYTCLVIGSRIYYPRTFSEEFKSRLRCTYLDHRGFVEGASPESGESYGIPEIVADMESARQELGLDQFVLIGHSIHGLIALAYAQEYPQHVTHVIAIGPPPEYTSSFVASVGEFWEAEASPGRKEQHAHNRARLTQDSLARLSPNDVFVADYVANAAHYWLDSTYDSTALWEGVHVNATLLAQIFDVDRGFSLDRSTTAISVPVYVALGRYDFAVPYVTWDQFESPFTDVTVQVFDSASHTPQLEDATAFDTAVLQWLSNRQ